MAARLQFKPPWSPDLEALNEGIWRVRGDIKHGMNVYLLADGDGVTAFDAGTKPMVKAVRTGAERLGGLKRVVLGHSHSDHRGTAPYLDAPVYCHVDEKVWAEKPTWQQNAPYWDMDLLSVGYVRWLYKHYLHDRWDGGAVPIAGTLTEGDDVCGFEVKHLPGHSPGQIALWREADGLAITTDVVYFADSERLKPLDYPNVPHRAWNWDHEKARESVHKLAELGPRTLYPGHEEPHSSQRLGEELERAADAG
ncbi:MAG: MBL fold metallo-hydrolase [Actinomycetota bacterium]|nr:MBL fold metallo-hydrolase [Actinomycetota bacterium]